MYFLKSTNLHNHDRIVQFRYHQIYQLHEWQKKYSRGIWSVGQMPQSREINRGQNELVGSSTDNKENRKGETQSHVLKGSHLVENGSLNFRFHRTSGAEQQACRMAGGLGRQLVCSWKVCSMRKGGECLSGMVVPHLTGEFNWKLLAGAELWPSVGLL